MLKKMMLLVCILVVSPWVWSQQAVIKTNLGDIFIELKPESAPNTVANFKKYVDTAFYDGLIFHRVIAGFMVQGGGFDAQMQQKNAPYRVVNESIGGLSNKRGSLAMARTNDPHSASSQFYINLVDNNSLDAKGQAFGYTVFAEVLSGMEVVDQIAQKPTGRKYAYSDVPNVPILIESIQWVQSGSDTAGTSLETNEVAAPLSDSEEGEEQKAANAANAESADSGLAE